MLNAAMKEFAQKGYKNASTDIIVKEAAISKGALFHYFKNKKGLFLFLYDYAMDIIKNEIVMKLNKLEMDVFERRKKSALLKLEVLRKHPEMYDFILAAYMDGSDEVKSDLEDRNKVLIAYGQSILNEGLDTSKFKDGIDPQKAIEIINWTTEGFTKKHMEMAKSYSLYEQNFEQLIKELDIYLDTLKKCFYKND
ncbi:TetR/AcrR family transcriptional regulator [Pseudobacteroides cellulosolvens]|uniref:TetR/AcrR family transcriptional regulator n=1 Tax=Pseudobacteroides cellulosolvens TaxID=35825 RepID=UPI0023EA66E1|nr:TetR/AcrR family transcriptional regulator [Pseudobacteroides cellulosolvens]